MHFPVLYTMLVKSRNIFALLMLFSSISAFGRQLTPSEAISRLSHSSHKVVSQNGIQKTYTLAYTARDDEYAYYYVMNVNDGNGFYVLSADDCAPAILGFCDKGVFDFNEAPSQLKWWLAQYETMIKSSVKSDLEQNTISVVEHEPIAPLLTCAWGQDSPYNTLCVDNGYTAPTGCGATAMAQIMYYHKWPLHGTSSKVYHDTTSGEDVVIRADFSSSTYDWDSMLDTYTPEDSGASADAVALLMHDCGVSIEMSYGKMESGANYYNCALALNMYFGYSREAFNASRIFYSDEQWELLLLEELSAGRPVLYAGNSSDGGHIFVCDGYAGDGYYHFNWGWSGIGNGYYLVPGLCNLEPVNQETGVSVLNAGFAAKQMALTHIHKKDEGESFTFEPFICLEEGYELMVSDNMLRVNAPFSNCGTASSSKMMLGVNFEQNEETKTVQVREFDSRMYPGHYYDDFYLNVDLSAEGLSGEYTVYPVYSSTYTTSRGGLRKYTDFVKFPLPYNYKLGKITVDGDNIGVVEPATSNVQNLYKPVTSGSLTFNMLGQKVDHPRSGIYISNGKKVFVK